MREGDILLFCSDHYNRTAGHAGVPRRLLRHLGRGGALDGGPRREDLRRRDDQPRPRLPDRRYPTHRACAERGLTHYENLNNLKDVVNQRFVFFGFPLRLEPAYGSPVRAVGVVDD